MSPSLQLVAISNIPLIEPDDALAAIFVRALQQQGLALQEGDTLVVAQKIISKAEGQYAYLNAVEPTPRALELAAQTSKPAALVQLILDESVEVLRVRGELIIVRHNNGYVHANAGIDHSNILSQDNNPRVLLLPKHPEKSAQVLREKLEAFYKVHINIIINDSAGRPWRNGIMGFALATSGFMPVVDKVGNSDLFDRPMQATQVAVADELAAAASLLMGQADEGMPVVLVRGAALEKNNTASIPMIRDYEFDLFK